MCERDIFAPNCPTPCKNVFLVDSGFPTLGVSQSRLRLSNESEVVKLVGWLGALALQHKYSRTLSYSPGCFVQVFQWSGERPPDIARPLDCFSDRGALTSYAHVPPDGGSSGIDGQSVGPEWVIPTVSVQVLQVYQHRDESGHALYSGQRLPKISQISRIDCMLIRSYS